MVIKRFKKKSFEELYTTPYIYRYLDSMICNSWSGTRKKDIFILRYNKHIYDKNNIYAAVKFFITLANDCKDLKVADKIIIKEKIQNYVEQNVFVSMQYTK